MSPLQTGEMVHKAQRQRGEGQRRVRGALVGKDKSQ